VLSIGNANEESAAAKVWQWKLKKVEKCEKI